MTISLTQTDVTNIIEAATEKGQLLMAEPMVGKQPPEQGFTVDPKKIVHNYHAYFSSHYGKQAGEAKSAWGKEVKLVRVGEIAEGDWNKVVKFHNAMIKAISDGTVRFIKRLGDA